MSKVLEILIIHDSPDATEIVLHELRLAGYELACRRVASRGALLPALGERCDVVLCNGTLVDFDALAAIALVREHAPDLPIIVVADALGEERAVECIRAGAEDVVLTSRLTRLVPAIERELAERRRRTDRSRDAEQLRRTEALLARTEKLRLLGQMAAGLSHDLKNLLNPLSLYLDLADRALARGDIDRARFGVTELKQVIQLGVQTIDRLRMFSRPAVELKFTPIDLDAVAEEAIALARRRVWQASSHNVTILAELGGPLEVLGERADLVSAVLNLLANSIEAMPHGGTVRVRTGSEGEQRWLEVIDDGPGMPPAVRDKVFEPFFSINRAQHVTGLGLAIVQSAMLRHDGRITLTSEPGRGTTFRLTFSPA